MTAFALNDKVDLIGTYLTGTVIGIAQYSNGWPDQFMVKYLDSQGNPKVEWFITSDICKRD